MSFENFISYRYLTSKKGRFLSFLNFISIAGVAIGVASLIVVTGVMTGFGNNLREKIIGTTPHIMVEKEGGITDYDQIRLKINTLPAVVDSSPYIQGNIFLEEHSQAVGVVMRGIVPSTENHITKVDQYIVKGKMEDLGSNKVFIGSGLARYFGYSVGDTVTLIAPSSGVAGKGWRYTLTIAGIFKTGMADYDMNLILVDLAQAQQILNLPSDIVSGIGVKVHDPYKADIVKQQIYGLLGYSFLLKSWIDINQNLFQALFLEKWGLFLILTMMILIASFNIISTLIVTVTSKIHDIGILQSIGVTKKSIKKIFTRQGMSIGMVGIFWGLIGGIGISYILKTYVKVPAEIYSIDHVPVELQTSDMIITVLAAFLISYLATIYPASRAAKLQPVEALRYE